MPSLTVIEPDGQTRQYPICGDSVRIGRSGQNDLVLDDPTVSRMHVEVVLHREGYSLVDLGGRFGATVNGIQVTSPVLLRPGDKVSIGRTSIVFHDDGAAQVEITPRPLTVGPTTRILNPDQVAFPTEEPTPSGTTPTVRRGPASGPPRATGERLAARATFPCADCVRNPSRVLDLVLEADRELTFHRPIEEILEGIMGLAERAIGYERGALMMLDGDGLQPRVVRKPASLSGERIEISRTIVERVMQRGESILTTDALTDPRFRDSRSLLDARVRSVMCVPMRDEQQVIGLLYVDSRRASGLYSEDDLRVLSHLASVAAVKIDNARLFGDAVRLRDLENERRQAAAIQEHLLPTEAPSIPGYSVFGQSVPCHVVGGDCFDYIALPEQRHVIQLGDVAGHGLPASLLMCCYHSSLRAVAASGLSPAETMGRLNDLLHGSIPSNRFVASFYGVLDPLVHRLTYVNAGLDPPYLIRPRGEPQPLRQFGLLLGMFGETDYSAGSVDFAPGDVLFCYSDGATDGAGPTGEMFGIDRVMAAAAQALDGTSEAIVAAVAHAIDLHHAGVPHQDDITLLAVKRMV